MKPVLGVGAVTKVADVVSPSSANIVSYAAKKAPRVNQTCVRINDWLWRDGGPGEKRVQCVQQVAAVSRRTSVTSVIRAR